jgi:hypothetical protein
MVRKDQSFHSKTLHKVTISLLPNVNLKVTSFKANITKIIQTIVLCENSENEENHYQNGLLIYVNELILNSF